MAGDASREGMLRWGLTVGGPWWHRAQCSSGKESVTRMGDRLEGPKKKPLCSGPTTAQELGLQLKSCGRGYKRDSVYICISFPSTAKKPLSLPSDKKRDQVNWNVMWCSFIWHKFFKCLPCVWLGAYDRMVDKIKYLPSRRLWSETVSKVSWVPVYRWVRDTNYLTWKKKS